MPGFNWCEIDSQRISEYIHTRPFIVPVHAVSDKNFEYPVENQWQMRNSITAHAV